MSRDTNTILRSIIIVGAAFVVTGVALGALCGAAAGGLGGLVAAEERRIVTWIAALLAFVWLVVDIVRPGLPIPQRDRETERAWVDDGWMFWAMKNGAALGVGFTSRVGFPIWYLIPAGSVAAGSPVIGASAWGAYALARNLSSSVIAWRTFGRKRAPHSHLARVLLSQIGRTRRVTDALALVVVGAVLVTWG